MSVNENIEDDEELSIELSEIEYIISDKEVRYGPDDDYDYSKGIYSEYIQLGFKNIIDFKEFANQLIDQKVVDLGFQTNITNYIKKTKRDYAPNPDYNMRTSYGLYNQFVIFENFNLRFNLLWAPLKVGVNHLMFHKNYPFKAKKKKGSSLSFFQDSTEFVSVKENPDYSFPSITGILGQKVTEIYFIFIKPHERIFVFFPNNILTKSLNYYKGNIAVQFKFQNEHSIVIGSNLIDTPLYVNGGMLLLPFEKVDLTKVEEIIKIA